MTTIEWITLLSSIGTLSAALVAVFTLFELSRQRKSAYKPDICILKKSFDLKIGSSQDLPLVLNWEPTDHKHYEGMDFPKAGLRIVNIGFGAAKKIKLSWEFDMDFLFLEVNQLSQKACQAFYFQKDEHCVSLISKGQMIYGVAHKNWDPNFEYLLPYNIDADGMEISLPLSYTLLVSAYLSLYYKNNRLTNDVNIPSLNLKLSYNDIGKNIHYSKHELKLKIYKIVGGSDAQNQFPTEFGVELTE